MNQGTAAPDIYEIYKRDGYALLDFSANDDEISEVEEYIAARVAQGHEGNVYDDNRKLRAVHGYDRSSGMLSNLMDRFADISKSFLDCRRVYVYQFRVNVKNGAGGEQTTAGSWKPHRDFDYWQKMDGMRAPRAAIFHMLVNEHNAHNGPLEVCPGTHKYEPGQGEMVIASESDWKAGFSENIKYQIDAAAFSRTRSVPIHGEPGSLLVMHPKLWHASSPNMTDRPRILLSIVFNDLANAVENTDRPPFIVQEPRAGTW